MSTLFIPFNNHKSQNSIFSKKFIECGNKDEKINRDTLCSGIATNVSLLKLFRKMKFVGMILILRLFKKQFCKHGKHALVIFISSQNFKITDIGFITDFTLQFFHLANNGFQIWDRSGTVTKLFLCDSWHDEGFLFPFFESFCWHSF